MWLGLAYLLLLQISHKSAENNVYVDFISRAPIQEIISAIEHNIDKP